MADLNVTPEEAELLKRAYEHLQESGVAQGAAILDNAGRTFVASEVHVPSLDIDALTLAVAQALSAGAESIESAVVVSTHGMNAIVNLDTLRDVVGKGRNVILGDENAHALAVRIT